MTELAVDAGSAINNMEALIAILLIGLAMSFGMFYVLVKLGKIFVNLCMWIWSH